MGLRATIEELTGLDVPRNMTEDREQKVVLALLVDIAKTLHEICDHTTLAYVPADLYQAAADHAAAEESAAAEAPGVWAKIPPDVDLARIAYRAYSSEITPAQMWPLVAVSWEEAEPLTQACWLAAVRAVRDALTAPE
jgi:hypothetical protein